MISWDHWQSFLAVLDEGSLSAAARRLRLTQPTLGRHIDQLEAALGVVLFTRAQDGVTPSGMARALEDQARAMQAAAAALARAASAPEAAERGTVRLAASEVVGAEVLPGVLAEFSARHPGIGIELLLDNRNVDLVRQTADLAVRMVRPTQKALVIRPLGVAGLGLYAHRDYLARAGVPEDVAALEGHALVGPESARALAGVAIGGVPVTPDWFRHRCDSDLGQIALVRAGMGIGVFQHAVARRDAALVRVLPEVELTLAPHLVFHEALKGTARVRLLADHLAEALRRFWA